MAKLSPLAPAAFPILPAMAGVRFATAACGLRYQGRTDLLLAELSPGTTVAGVFTRSLASSAPVDWCRVALKGGKARAIVVNSGNANAFTGKAGDAAVQETVRGAARLVGCDDGEVFIASTGVIGEALDASKIVTALPALHGKLTAAAWEDAARAIMTTDTFPKGATRRARLGDTVVTISGFCKGSGMIAPDMATMLAFIFTDAKLPASVLQTCLTSANERTFNAITVDGDTSTSDTVLLCATGEATNKRVARPSDRVLADFCRALEEVMLDLAHQVVKDGEGAEKFVTIKVTGAASSRAGRIIAMAIANSPLVKTAIAGADANWGRIVGAVGKAGQRANRDRLKIAIGGVTIAENGAAVPKYDETPVVAHMKGRDIQIAVDVGIGRGRATVWTCDLTHGYIDINGSYRS